MQQLKELEDVNLFMKVMGQEMPDSPIIPNPLITSLRFKLIAEENKELLEAAIATDIVEVADALCDILYVSLGAFTAYGFKPELVQELFAEVQRSNMSKTCANQEEAERTIDKLVSEDTEKSGEMLENGESVLEQYSMQKVDECWVVSRVSDNKVMKSIGYSKPDLKSILIKYGVEC